MQKDLLQWVGWWKFHLIMIKIGEVMIILNRSVVMKTQIRNLLLSDEGASVLSANLIYRTMMMSLPMWASFSPVERAVVAIKILLQQVDTFSWGAVTSCRSNMRNWVLFQSGQLKKVYNLVKFERNSNRDAFLVLVESKLIIFNWKQFLLVFSTQCTVNSLTHVKAPTNFLREFLR